MIEYFYNFHLWIAGMQSHKQSELRCYLHHTKNAEILQQKFIHRIPYFVKMYPCGFFQMTALDPELSNASLAMKIEFSKLNLETIWKLQSHISNTVSSSAASTANTILLRHQPVPPQQWLILHLFFLWCHQFLSLLQDFCTVEVTYNGETNYRSATIFGILLPRNVATATSVAPTRASASLLDAFHAHEAAQGTQIGVSHKQVLQTRERSFYILNNSICGL